MKTILVIEDNAEVRENTAELLELDGYRVITAINGKTGFSQALTDHPDVILCDVMMPETDGVGFLKLIKAEKSTCNIPLIFFSAGSAPLAVRRGLEQGGDEYLQKPFTHEELLGAVERYIGQQSKNSR